MADTDPNSSERNLRSTLDGSYRGHIRRKRIVAAVIVLLLLAPLTYLVVNQILQNRSSIGAAPNSAAIVGAQIDQVTPTEILSQGVDANAPTLAQSVSVTPIVLPSETATAATPTEAATAISTSTVTATPAPTDTPQPAATKEVTGQSAASTTPTPPPTPTHAAPTATPSAQPTPHTVSPDTGGETPGLDLFQIVGLILLGVVLILLGSALIAQPARR